MTAPRHVPSGATLRPKYYSSPPTTPRRFNADRPGEIDGEQPRGEGFGSPGPDQGYVLKLAKLFHGRLHLQPGEHEADALAGCSLVALQRASLFGRAPVVHDLRLALSIWGFLDPTPPKALVEERKLRFAEVAHSHDPMAGHRVTDCVDDDMLRLPSADIEKTWRSDWQDVVDVAGDNGQPH